MFSSHYFQINEIAIWSSVFRNIYHCPAQCGETSKRAVVFATLTRIQFCGARRQEQSALLLLLRRESEENSPVSV
jgi:hypothetical protein